VFFDTLSVSFFLCFFKFLVFEAAIYTNKDVYIVDEDDLQVSEKVMLTNV